MSTYLAAYAGDYFAAYFGTAPAASPPAGGTSAYFNAYVSGYFGAYFGIVSAGTVPITVDEIATADDSTIGVPVDTHGGGFLVGTSVSGVTYKQNGATRTPASVAVASHFSFDITTAAPVYVGDVVTFSVHSSDLTDANGDPMADVTDYPVTNNSTVPRPADTGPRVYGAEAAVFA